jgi:DNA polymerase-3 subunit beta
MKLTIDRRELARAVDFVSKAAAKKADISVVEGILIDVLPKEVTLTCYNLSLGIITKVAAATIDTGSLCLDAKTFAEIVKKLPEEKIEIESDGKKIKIKSGESEFNLMGMDATQFPELPEIDAKDSFGIDPKTLSDMIRQTIFSVSKISSSKVVHTGVKFEGDNGFLRLISTDGFRLSYRETPSDANVEFVVPADALYEVAKMCKETFEAVNIYKAKRHILFRIGEFTVISRLLEGDFLKYQTIISGSSGISTKVNTDSLLEALNRVSIIISDKTLSPLRACFGDNKISLEAATALASGVEVVPVDGYADNIEMGLNAGFFAEALKATEKDDIMIEIKDPLSPVMLKPKEGSGFCYLILPVRLKK